MKDKNGTRKLFEGLSARFTEAKKVRVQGCDLSGLDLRWADFTGADLRGTNLMDAKLRDGSLAKTACRGIIIAYAQIPGTDLRVAWEPMCGAKENDKVAMFRGRKRIGPQTEFGRLSETEKLFDFLNKSKVSGITVGQFFNAAEHAEKEALRLFPWMATDRNKKSSSVTKTA